jgi:hypothetical protein
MPAKRREVVAAISSRPTALHNAPYSRAGAGRSAAEALARRSWRYCTPRRWPHSSPPQLISIPPHPDSSASPRDPLPNSTRLHRARDDLGKEAMGDPTTTANATATRTMIAPEIEQAQRLFQCSTCKRSFTRVDHLTRHVRSRKWMARSTPVGSTQNMTQERNQRPRANSRRHCSLRRPWPCLPIVIRYLLGRMDRLGSDVLQKMSNHCRTVVM